MGLLDGKTHRDYYTGNNFGNYQFTSLEDVINYFMVAYVGEDKIIPKAKRLDIAFHAQRAMQELSFDTFKSIKSQQITLPPTLLMTLPHDYVNYTKLSWSDSSGIKHPLYHTKDTSNPFQIGQKSDGSYNFDFTTDTTGNVLSILENSDFSSDLTTSWEVISPSLNLTANYNSGMAIDDGKLKTSFQLQTGSSAIMWTSVHTAYQAIDVSEINYLDLSAAGVADTLTIDSTANPGVLRFGLSTIIPDQNFNNNTNNVQNAAAAALYTSNNINSSIFDLTTYGGDNSYIEWIGPVAAGQTSNTQELLQVDVSAHSVVYAVVVSFLNLSVPSTFSGTKGTTALQANSIDDLTVTRAQASTSLIAELGNEKNSSTWNSYKAVTPSENNSDDYEDDTYWPMHGERYGLDPQHAQANGSFYIDPRLGRIHFSSNISGKTVILDYISDGLGTDAEMQVHKLAEDAMYKCIAHSFLSTSSYGQQLVPRLTKEKFAAVRKAKLRLSNIKLEELTQILRGKSKQIKH